MNTLRLGKSGYLVKLLAFAAGTIIVACPAVSNDQPNQSLDDALRALASGALDLSVEQRCSDGDETFAVSYRLFEPLPIRPGLRYPLIVWLHGYGKACGTDNFRQLNHADRLFFQQGAEGKRPFYFLALQCPRTESGCGWNAPLRIGERDLVVKDMIEVLLEVIRETVAVRAVDPNKITIVGISGGGSACWEIVARAPTRFAAAVPISAGPPAVSSIPRLTKTAVWAFHSPNDKVIASQPVEATVAAIRAAGGATNYSETAEVGHLCWDSAFELYGVKNWLLQQDRSNPNSPPPGSNSGASFKSAIARLWVFHDDSIVAGATAAVLALFALICYREVRKPKPRRIATSASGEPIHPTGEPSSSWD